MPREKKPAAPRGSAVRKLAPVVPLAIALLHGALTKHQAPTPAPSPAPPVVTESARTPSGAPSLSGCGVTVPCPMLAKGKPVMWWFVYKLKQKEFPMCGAPTDADGADRRTCAFGGKKQTTPYGLRYIFASSVDPTLTDGGQECLGNTKDDPVGATFAEVWDSGFHFVIWNDQFYDTDPKVEICSKGDCGAPWGHSKGILVWNDQGEGFVMQVSTPEWPGAARSAAQRKIGNTLGCHSADNDVQVAQHFFALRLKRSEVVQLLGAMKDAGVVTDPNTAQLAEIGGPADVEEAAKALGNKPNINDPIVAKSVGLSSGVTLLWKSSNLNAPTWQAVSSMLGGVSLRTATWTASPPIAPTTKADGKPACWNDGLLKHPPGAVDIAKQGSWDGVTFGLGSGANHAKLGVSTDGKSPLVIFGDENQQGTLDGVGLTAGCAASQNGRGGMFFALSDPTLFAGVTKLLAEPKP